MGRSASSTLSILAYTTQPKALPGHRSALAWGRLSSSQNCPGMAEALWVGQSRTRPWGQWSKGDQQCPPTKLAYGSQTRQLLPPEPGPRATR